MKVPMKAPAQPPATASSTTSPPAPPPDDQPQHHQPSSTTAGFLAGQGSPILASAPAGNVITTLKDVLANRCGVHKLAVEGLSRETRALHLEMLRLLVKAPGAHLHLR
eukprot:PhM_4_TR11644/c3_g1_i2/m.68019